MTFLIAFEQFFEITLFCIYIIVAGKITEDNTGNDNGFQYYQIR